MINYSYCKKDFKEEMNDKYENYLNDREINKNILTNENTSNENISNNKKKQPPPTEYNKEEFLDEIMRIHNDIYFDPYKILEIDREYTPTTLKEKYKEMALKYHPDKGGDIEVFQDITKSYIYLLKKYKENMPDKQIFELKDEFNDFKNDQKNNKNTLLGDRNFNLNNFNNTFNEHFTKTTKGYDDFLKNGEIDLNTKKTENNSYIFSDKFNLSIFNKIFNTTSKKMKKETLIVYKEPETVFQSNAGYSEIGENDELEDYTSGFTFDKKIHYTDCKKAYTAPEDLNSIQMDTYDSIDQLENHRKNISYNMSDDDKNKYNNFIELNRIKELQRQKKIEKNDLNILKKYKKFNNIMLENK
jgi:curved DNA-binding protein CbpA